MTKTHRKSGRGGGEGGKNKNNNVIVIVIVILNLFLIKVHNSTKKQFNNETQEYELGS